jgi:2-polyprenyl-3-methyl-5-hydroxy-6-metoxy-1,4-benzoquinol methylase/uncharacterized protein YbaR (Trm112 family)
MHRELIGLLRCPTTGQRLEWANGRAPDDPVLEGSLVTPDGTHTYEVRGGIPRFVPESNYADSFGMQWNLFRKTQLDSHSGLSISAERFWASTGWSTSDLRGRRVLDCGCGAGRFGEIALQAGANVVAVDYSSAADACFDNLGSHPNLNVVQADIYRLPFDPGAFDFVYSMGVLQHTPDVRAAFEALPKMVAKGGNLCVDFYELTWKHRLLPRHLLRAFTKNMTNAEILRFCQRWVPGMLRVSMGVGRIPRVGNVLARAIPVADYSRLYQLKDNQLLEWAVLDTFDWLSPKYDQPQKRSDVSLWLSQAGFAQIQILKSGFLIARGMSKL